MKKSNVTSFPKEKVSQDNKNVQNSLSPREIVSELDRFVVGQNKAKRAVAIALRNRWRRQALTGDMKDEVLPKNILMIGPTGVGKTEISRRLSKLAEAPFVKVEATRFTEVGYVGRDVEQIIRDLLEIAIAMEKVKKRKEVHSQAQKLAEAPFIKVEATRFTEVGYVGRDVEQIVRDLIEIAIAMEKVKKRKEVYAKAQKLA